MVIPALDYPSLNADDLARNPLQINVATSRDKLAINSDVTTDIRLMNFFGRYDAFQNSLNLICSEIPYSVFAVKPRFLRTEIIFKNLLRI